MKKHLLPAALCAATLLACRPAPQLGQAPVEDVIGAMTLEEKVRLVVGSGMSGLSGDSAVIGETHDIVPGAAGTTCPIERLGIPAVVLADGPAGLRIDPTREGDTATYYCTHFPIGTLLASTWDTGLVDDVGRAIGNEALEYGADVLLAPALNIQRNPLCGRNFEYYSEDPVLSGRMAAAYVQGVQSNGVGTSIKHFAVNNQETNRMANDARVSQRALREIYLKGFEIAVKKGRPWTVMSSYNYLNGTYTSESPELLTSLLRGEWGFSGMVMTDWFGGRDAVAQMKAGNDMLQPGYDRQYTDIVQGVKSGQLDEEVLDANVRRILEMILRTPRFRGYRYSNRPDLKAHAALTRRSAAEGMVLLKNDSSALPLDSTVRRLALFGCTSYDFIPGGTGSGNVNRAYTVSLPEGLRGAGYAVDDALEAGYRDHIAAEKKRLQPSGRKDPSAAFMPIVLPEEMEIGADELKACAGRADVAVLTIGRGSGEFRDRGSSGFDLNRKELRLITDVCDAFHAAGKRVVVVLNIGGPVETASWRDLPDAILCAWQGGQEGGNSVADILSGKVSPSGKLPMTFPVWYQDHASTENFPVNLESDPGLVAAEREARKAGRVANVDYTDYEEDIYVGYRYFDSFNRQVSYPFGYGLSYTTFEYANPVIESSGGLYTVRVDVTNTGTVPGREVVQLYVSAHDAAKANKPDKELKDFAKTATLQPGETATVRLAVPVRDLASFDEAASSWTVSEGEYRFLVGASSRDIRATLTAPVPASAWRVGNILKPQVELRLLRR